MSEKVLYKLQNLKCSYSKKKTETVLEIKNLEIPKGELIIILGESGSGKTTLLETLALMNDTLIDGSKLLFKPNATTGHKFEDLWKTKSPEISEIRKNEFSFIFQDTNLMPNFNVSENIVLTKLIQGDKTENSDIGTISKLIKETHLEKIDPDKSPFALSGGEKQRIAFVRAVYPKYSVLFGDEPTGSLDDDNSKNIMDCLRKEVDEKGKTVIIVSHNIDLSLLYADRIIVLEKKNTCKHSIIKPENIFVSKNKKWFIANNNHEIINIKQNIKNILNPNISEEQSTPNYEYDNLKTSCFEQFLKRKFGIKDFSLLFFKKEFRSLFNIEINFKKRKFKGFSILLCLFITALSIGIIGHINGQLAELEKEQQNPVMMRMVLPVSKESSAHIIETIEQNVRTVNAKKTKGKKDFGLKNVSGQNPIYLPIKDFNAKDSFDDDRRYARGLTVNVDKDSLLIRHLVFGDSLKNDKAKYNPILDENSIALIVTSKFLKELNYPETCPYLFLQSREEQMPYITLPVAAVVAQLPNELDFLCTEYFEYNYIAPNKEKNSFTPSVADTKLEIFLNKPDVNEQEINKTLYDFFKKESINIDTIYISGLKIDIRLTNNVNIYDLYNKTVQKNKLFEGNLTSFLRFDYETENIKTAHKNEYNYIVLNFDNYKNIDDFSKWFGNHFKNIDYSIISEKSVFQKISDIASLAIWIIIFLAMTTVTVLFVNLLSNHLDKISRNIGSYLAFGLEPNTLYKVYIFVIGVFISLIICMSIIFNLIAKIFVSTVLNHSTIYLTIGIIIVSSLLCSYWALKNYLTKTPGDLIYNRPKKTETQLFSD